MKAKPLKLPATYLNIIERAQNVQLHSDKDEIIYLLRKIEQVSSIPISSFASFFILDYSQKKYHIVAESAIRELGYRPEELFEAGIDFLFHAIHPEDFIIYSEEVVKRTLHWLKDPEQKNYFFSCNYRVKTKDKRYAQILQKGSYIKDPVTGVPLYSFGSITNVASFKTDSSMTFIVDEYETPLGISQRKTVFSNTFFPEPDEALLTPREREIPYWIADGLSTKEIAKKLHISINTVFNHRRNMFRKTNSHNVTDIFRYGIEQKLI